MHSEYICQCVSDQSAFFDFPIGGIDGIHMKPGSKVLYLGAAAGTTVSHVSDIVGPTGCVYAVEFAHRPGRDLINMAKSRTNVIPIIEDARHPLKYRMLMGKTIVSQSRTPVSHHIICSIYNCIVYVMLSSIRCLWVS